MNIVLVGSGLWGQKYIQTLDKFSNVHLKIANRNNWQQLIDTRPDGVIVATPPDSHIQIASHALELNIPVIIEKPLALSLENALELDKFKAPILVNYIHLFAPAYEDLKQRIGKIKSIHSVNQNKGPFRPYSSLLDYGSHDVAMCLDLAKSDPNIITAVEHTCTNGSLYDLFLQFNTINAFCSIGNGANKKRQFLSVFSDNGEFIYDDAKTKEFNSTPLENMLKVFFNAIDGKFDYRLGLKLSLEVLSILQQSQKTLRISSII